MEYGIFWLLLVVVSLVVLTAGVLWTNGTLKRLLQVQMQAAKSYSSVWRSIIRLHEENLKGLAAQRRLMDNFIQLSDNVVSLAHRMEDRLHRGCTLAEIDDAEFKELDELEDDLVDAMFPLTDEQLMEILETGEIPEGVVYGPHESDIGGE